MKADVIIIGAGAAGLAGAAALKTKQISFLILEARARLMVWRQAKRHRHSSTGFGQNFFEDLSRSETP